jgi:signal transduction histidine kinase/CheY-like chemotaxis protein
MPETWTGAGDEAALRLLATRAPAILWSTDRALRVTTCTGRGLAAFEKRGSALLGLRIPCCFGVQESCGASEAAQRQALTGTAATYEVFWRPRWFRCHVAPLVDAHGAISGVVGAALEITESKRLEAELIQSQKMESIGRLAGGIAHDFNNLLTSILGYAELAAVRMENGPVPREELEAIKAAGLRAADLTRQLLAFSRKQLLHPRVLSLNAVVEEFAPILRRTIGEHIDLRVALEPSLGRVRADRGQVEQTLMNLVVNARDAMPGGGTLTVETANVTVNEVQARLRPGLKPGSYSGIRVADTGTGMDVHTLSRLFEPFFTTKELGRGTGLGLSTVYGIVKQSGGYIGVESALGKGSTFEVLLPRVSAELEAEASDALPAQESRGSETVLVVEDEESLLELAVSVLRGSGYVVLAARDGAQALEVCQRYAGPIDLLLTDVVMPRMGGAELARKVGGLRPNCRVLFMSGYSGEQIARQGVLEPDVMLLEKPFTPDVLSRKVRKALGRSA